MAHRLNVVAIRPYDERSVIIGMVDFPYAGWSIVFAADLERGFIERVDLGAILREEGDVHRVLFLGMRTEPKLGFSMLAESGPTFNFHDWLNTKRSEGLSEESLALLVVAHGQPDVINDHVCLPEEI